MTAQAEVARGEGLGVVACSLSAVVVASLLFVGCAPLGDLRPASGMMPGKTFEVGGGGVRLGPRPYVAESSTYTGQLWFSANATPRWTLSGVSAFDNQALAVGGAVRYNALLYDRFHGSAEVQAGYAWGAFTLPLAVRLFDQTWIYTSPRFGTLDRYPSFSIPAGVSARIYEGFMLRGEVQGSWQNFDPYNRRVHLALGAAYQW